MLGVEYATKKALKERVGKGINVIETSLHGIEYKSNGSFTVVGPYPRRVYYATVTMENDIVKKVE